MNIRRFHLLIAVCQLFFGVSDGFQSQGHISITSSPISGCWTRTISTDSCVRIQRPQFSSLYYREENGDGTDFLTDKQNVEMANNFLRASRSSFKNFESLTIELLNRQPLLALTIFVGLGLMTAYMLGFLFLGGYMETWNPAENDSIPYWDDEVLIISRNVGR